MDKNKPGVVIRRRPEEAATPAATPDPAEAAAATAPGTDSVAPVNTPAADEPAAIVPEPAPASVHARGSTEDRRVTTWRHVEVERDAHPQAAETGAEHASAPGDSPSVPAPAPAPRPAPPQPAVNTVSGPMPTTDDFAALLGTAPIEVPVLSPGDRVRARIVSFGRDVAFVSLGAKSEGSVPTSDLLDADGSLRFAVGDEIEAYVTRIRPEGVELAVTLGRGADGDEAIAQAAAASIPVEGRVIGTNKGGFDVEVLGKRAFCPFSQMDADHGGEPDSYVGRTLRFLVTQYDEDGRRIVVSRAALQRTEREAKAGETLANLHVGQELDGIVTRVQAFGAFVDIGGVDGLVHVSELSWGRPENAEELVKPGDTVRVRVLRIDDADDTKNRRIALSMKALQEDPWHTAVANMQLGGTYSGTVTRLEKFGAFIELRPGVEGLVHISELTTGKRINHPKEVLSVGDAVQVQLIDMDPRKRQLALSVKATQDDPWATAASQFSAGMALQGTVQAVEKFGVFIELPGGLRGLLPLSQLGEGDEKALHTRFRAGNAVEVRVLEVDASRRRLTLTRRDDVEETDRAAFAEYRAAQRDAGGLGTFADLLAKRGR